MKKLFVAISCLSLGLMALPTDIYATNDDPLAGLNLNDSSELHASDGTAVSPFVIKFKGHLVTLDNGRLKAFDVSTLKDVKYWAFYYSASWCPPCRAFTPRLVDFYNNFKKSHPNFELIFVNYDQTEDDMLAYMKTDEMTWPAVRFSDIDDQRLAAKKYCGSGIPCLVLTDTNGKVLSDSFQGQDYLGPQKVVDDIQKMVPKS